VTPSIAVKCAVCHQLIERCEVLLLEYQTATAALEDTPRSAGWYAARWLYVSSVSERLDEAERMLQVHQKRHGAA
jgi:hypothetical protein